MKKVTMNLWVPVFLALFISCLEGKKNQSVEVNSAQEVKDEKAVVPDQFDQGFMDGMTGTLWNYYSKIRLALVNSDLDATKTASGDLAKSFGEKHPGLREVAQQMADTDDLEEQRALFSELSEGLEPVFRETISEGAIYKQYCPMAFDNQGAYWLSNVPEVKNPYFGDKMLKCGSTKEVIKETKS